MRLKDVKIGMRVRTVKYLGGIDADFSWVDRTCINARKSEQVGRVLDSVIGKKSNLWWVMHEGGVTGVYKFSELNEFGPKK